MNYDSLLMRIFFIFFSMSLQVHAQVAIGEAFRPYMEGNHCDDGEGAKSLYVVPVPTVGAMATQACGMRSTAFIRRSAVLIVVRHS